jgi:Major Facilitator Superfamily
VIKRALPSLPLAIVVLNVTAVAVLVPDIRLDLGSSSSGGLWIVNAYLLALAALFPLLAPLRGRALTIAGALAMAAGAIVCARAGSTAALVTGQAIQGAGAAALLAPLTGGWPALALPAVALALGPAVGGVFAEQNWWHVFFWAGVPLAALGGAAGLAAPSVAPAEEATPLRLSAFAAGLTALTIALVQGEVWSWGWSALLLLGGAVMLGRAPLNRLPRVAPAWALLAACLTALIFLMPEYFQLARNLSGLRSGVLMLALTVAAVGAAAVSPWLGRRAPVAGVACLVAGLAILVTLDAHTRYALLIAALGLTGVGLGSGAAGVRAWQPSAVAAALPAALAGAALGLAGAGGAFQAAEADKREAGSSFEQALAAGVGWAAVFLLVLLAAAALLIWRRERPTPASSAARPAAES